MELAKYWTFTMDYEKNEIVINAVVKGEKIQLRACEKDINSMQNWFELAKIMPKN